MARLARFLRNLLIAATIAAAATWLISLFWLAIGGGDLPLHGWIALLIGSFGTVGLAWVLMGLAFRSHREGWDDRVDNSLDPGREDFDKDDRR
ncbi:MAG TPA: hypothetical protein VGB60_01675 [Brevundimonas sp.]|jgi:hypothetical protein|uniref:hypothetical protein n=1 Tax=Brevundimonas sp. TaxID=1871086 RepID=UPI002ED8C41C